MVCEHLRLLEQELLAAGVEATYRGQPWTSNCREWVYFNCCFDKASIRARLPLAECVKDHEHRGTHDGQEAGFYCSACHDGVMGAHPAFASKTPVYA